MGRTASFFPGIANGVVDVFDFSAWASAAAAEAPAALLDVVFDVAGGGFVVVAGGLDGGFAATVGGFDGGFTVGGGLDDGVEDAA